MSIWIIVIEAVVAISVVGVIGDTISKIAQSKAKAREDTAKGSSPAEVEALRGRIAALEARVEERDESLRRLEDEVRFVSRMLEDKSGGKAES